MHYSRRVLSLALIAVTTASLLVAGAVVSAASSSTVSSAAQTALQPPPYSVIVLQATGPNDGLPSGSRVIDDLTGWSMGDTLQFHSQGSVSWSVLLAAPPGNAWVAGQTYPASRVPQTPGYAWISVAGVPWL